MTSMLTDRDSASERIRVTHVSLQLDTGGMERLLTEFARHADRTRFELRFISLGARGSLAADIEAQGWSVTALNTPPGVRPGTIHRLAGLFASLRTDIVHTHNTKPLLYAGPAGRLARVGGIVHTRHGQRRGATSLHDRLFRLASRCADRMVCVSSDAARLCMAEGVRPARVRTIHNGIDLQRFSPHGPVEGGPAVYVGRLSAEKDVSTLLKAVAIAAGQDPAFRLLIAGAGPCERDLFALARTLGVSDRVQFLGPIDDVPALLRRASMFVLPSLSEGLPITVLEAMACGLPVVATRVGGTPEAVDHDRTGLLVPCGDPVQLAEAMLTLRRDVPRGRSMGASGRRRVEELFDIRHMVAHYEEIYREVVRPSERAAA